MKIETNKLVFQKIITGQQLVNTIRELCDKVKNRLWIAVPFIGNWDNVERIIGTKWITDTDVDVRLITDTSNEQYIKSDTIKKFQNRAEIKTLSGLHAKIYIIDNNAIITSANLSGFAFSKRYEIGILLDSEKCAKVFLGWWQISKKVASSWIPRHKYKVKREEPFHSKERGNLFELPEPPTKIKVFKDYPNYLKAYNHFKQVYEKHVKRVWENVPIYHEIDSFLNYLYHEHPNCPSKKFKRKKYRVLPDEKRIIELKKYILQYKKWLPTSVFESAESRLNRIKTVQKLLSPRRISKLKRIDIKSIVSCIHAMNLAMAKKKFLNPRNNALSTIKTAWHELLHDDSKPIDLRMEECKHKLFGFGKSSIQDLISCYRPEKYPVINSNSNCGLKFFGYDIKVY
ncbi:MAG: phospholipase D-like domain-containing protein [candidate division WOR-3 bacterium]